MELLRKYNEATPIYFPLPTYGSGDFNTTPPSFAAGDTKYSIDGASYINTVNSPTHIGQGTFQLNLVSDELKGSGVLVTIIDSAPKVWEDQSVVISTFGSISGRYDFDFDNNTWQSIYYADINFTRDQSNVQDEYTISWFKDGAPLASGSVSTPTIQVIKRSDSTDLIASSALSYVGQIGVLKKDEASNRISLGEAYIVQTQALINGATRTWRKLFSRDS